MTILIITVILICLLLFILDMITFRSVRLSCLASGSVQARNDAKCSITVENPGVLPLIYKRLLFEVDNTYTGEKKKMHIRVNVLPKSSSVCDMNIEVEHCGKIRCIVSGGRSGKKSAFCNFTILPELFSTHVEYNLHESDIYDCDTFSPYRKGQDYSEIYQIREYVPGDDVKHIHWKLSGRTDAVMVKDASFPLDKSLMVVMDKSVPDGTVTPEQSEALASITVSIARSLSDEGLDYQLVWNDTDADMVITREVQFEPELAEAIPMLLTGPVKVSGKTCADLYQQMVGQSRATHVIYVSLGTRAAESISFENSRVTDIDARAKDYKAEYREIDLY